MIGNIARTISENNGVVLFYSDKYKLADATGKTFTATENHPICVQQSMASYIQETSTLIDTDFDAIMDEIVKEIEESYEKDYLRLSNRENSE